MELQNVTGRPDPAAITIFKSNGLAIEDVVAAGWVYENIRQGTVVSQAVSSPDGRRKTDDG